MTTRQPIAPEEAKRRLGNALAEADVRRTAGLELLLQVRRARGRALKRGIARRQARRGADDPGAGRLARRLERNRATRVELDLLAVLARQQRPEVDDASWVVRGVVLSAANQGVPGVGVVLVDKSGTKLRNTPAATTGPDGSYEIRVPLTETDERGVFVELRKGTKKRRLHEARLTMEPGRFAFVPGYSIEAGPEAAAKTDPATEPQKKAPAKKAAARKTAAKKTSAKKATAKKTPAKKAPAGEGGGEEDTGGEG